MIKTRLEALRALMAKRNMSAYIIPTSDFHETEYVGEYFKSRAYMSGFSGSSATLVVGIDKAALWTDGRYFIQAENELKGSGIDLMKMGEPGVPTLVGYINELMSEGSCLGFDGRVINARLGMQLKRCMEEKGCMIKDDEDLVDLIWTDRPSLPKEKAFLFDIKYCGKCSEDKLKDVVQAMKKRKCTSHLIASLDDIAWLFNIRGNDIPCFPVVLAFALIQEEKSYLYLDLSKVSDEMKAAFTKINVELKEYNMIYEDVKLLGEDQKVMMDTTMINYRIYNSLVYKNQIVDAKNPTQLAKAIKNEVEINNSIQAHIKDGVAVTKFMYWLKTNITKMEISEISAEEKLLSLRQEQPGFVEPSFDTISAYKDHAAMMHYKASPESNATLHNDGFLLVDSGGQYYEGTTDITRTFALGTLDEKMKKHFTAVLRSLINLAKANFLYGVRGNNLDILARGPIWDMGIDYRCGTGHGIGFFLNVHESPNGFRWRIVPERNDSCVLEPGMITTDEPGIYEEGSHGIRSENELVVRRGEENEYGQFLHFETITLAPFDLDAIDPSLMNQDEIKWLNDYHQKVYQTLNPYMSEEESKWLKEYTKSI